MSAEASRATVAPTPAKPGRGFAFSPPPLPVWLDRSGDAGRACLAREKLESLAEYRIPLTRALEDGEIERSRVWRLRVA